MTIKRAIHDCMMASTERVSHHLPALLSLTDIVETTAVPSAAVECKAAPRLLINPDFVARHASTPEKLMMLIMHELHHVVLGHTRACTPVTPLDNFVFDAVINATLVRQFPQRPWTALLTEFYDHRKFPECFLRPPPPGKMRGWSEGEDPPEALRDPGMRDLLEVYNRLYSSQGATYSEVREALLSQAASTLPVVLLGNHENPEAAAMEGEPINDGPPGVARPDAPEAAVFRASLRQAVKGWGYAPCGCEQAYVDFANRRAVDRVAVPPLTRRQRLAHLLRSVAGPRGRAVPARNRQVELRRDTLIPRANRRSTVLSALGCRPLVHTESFLDLARTRGAPERRGERVHVYLDVSGSVQMIQGPLYRAVLESQEFVHPTVHLFSTEVADVTLAQLRRGVCESTGGTSIECVAKHMELSRVRRAIIVTDGFVGVPSKSAEQVLRACTLGLALVGEVASRSPLAGFARTIIELKEI